ncbi:MAG TPA: BMP family ABC transporter substrate-binding protein [Azospirillum sp.]
MQHPNDGRAGFPRRRVLQGLGAVALAAVAPGARAEAAPLAVGFLYPGLRADFGFNQAHADAARAIATLPGVRVEEAEGTAAELPSLVEEMVLNRGCRAVFVTDPGDWATTLLAQADAHRDTAFLLRGAELADLRLPGNVGVYDAHIYEGQHVCGIVAGYASRARRVGFVAGGASPRILRAVNAFALGVRRADATATVRLLRLGEGATADAVAKAGRELVADGVDVLAGHLDSVRPLCEVAEAAGIQCCGLHTDLSAIAPHGFLTGAEWNWTNFYADVVTRIQDGRPWPRLTRGGFGSGLVRSTRYGAPVAVDARAHADAARMQLANGNAAVFRGPITDNTGRTVLGKGQSLRSDDPALDRIVWLVDGVSVAGF